MTAGDSPARSRMGLTERFRIGEHRRVEESLERLRACGIARLRIPLCYEDYCTPGGKAWFDWLLPRLARDVELLPCIHHKSLHTSEELANFVDQALDIYGSCFDAIELSQETFLRCCEMGAPAARLARQRGMTVVLGGVSPDDLKWLRLTAERDILNVVDAVGLRAFPDSQDLDTGWEALIADLRGALDECNPALAIWITETGYSTWRHDSHAQVQAFRAASATPVERIYWLALQDLEAPVSTQSGWRFDDQLCHFGLYTTSGQPKLLARVLTDEAADEALTSIEAMAHPAILDSHPLLITGGAGFIGSNLAERLAAEGHDVLIYDSLDRAGVEENVLALRHAHRQRISVAIADIRDRAALMDAAADASAVFHFAAQVAVTTSMVTPMEDFDINCGGTVALLEAVRRRADPPPVIFASTNKVYGDLGDVDLENDGERYLPADADLRAYGINEDRPLDFHTPYGCSKGAADQYILDYGRSFGIPTAILRMSCIYGRRQRGTEDQGWVAHFLLRALAKEPITIYGDGRQVRDILWVDDAVDAYMSAWKRIGRVGGRAFNLGGGPANAVSLLQVIGQIESILGYSLALEFADWRPGDQRYFVADTRRAQNALGLALSLNWRAGLTRLADWMTSHRKPQPSSRTEAVNMVEVGI